jgi:hypothetical protein
MKFIKKYLFILPVILLVTALFLIRFLSNDHFRNGAEINAAPAISGSNILPPTPDNLSKDEALYINLDQGSNPYQELDGKILAIDPKSLLSSESLKLIKNSGGPVILISSDITILARSWMLLAQKGVHNLSIITNDNSLEVLKYEFRPDTTLASDTGIQ